MTTLTSERLDVATVAYVAGVIDLLGVIRTRTVQDTELPYLALSGPNTGMLNFLGEITGTRPTITRRAYSKAGCAEHCLEKHQHIQSVSGRWSISGAKATVVLWNVRPYMRLQVEEAAAALAVGTRAGFKPATLTKIAALGWELPDFGDHP